MSSLFSILDHDHRLTGAIAPASRVVRELNDADRESAVTLLECDALHTIPMLGMIADYGMSHPSLRGRFFGYFENQQLAGVALLGHAIMIYALPEAEESAWEYFARTAAEIRAKGHLVFGPRPQVEVFYKHLAAHGREKRLTSVHQWCVATAPRLPLQSMQLRRANLDELESLAIAQAEMIYESSGVDPRQSDSDGFLRRTAERIERKRTWVRLADGKVIFKVEIVSETAELAYLEGVWTHPDWRNRGIARSCMNEVVHRLLQHRKAICLTVSPEETAACRLYKSVGFDHLSDYLACFLTPLA